MNLNNPINISRILIVNKHPDILNYIKSLLENVYEVVTADNSKAALKITQDCHPQLILTDTDLQDTNGYEFTKCVKANPEYQHIPIILISEKSDKKLFALGRKFGVTCYLLKPFTPEELRMLVRSTLLSSLNHMLVDLNNKLQHIANHDLLTQLPNRLLFGKFIKEEMIKAKNNEAQFALLFVDINHFKAINDRLGHQMGDILLGNFAQVLLKSIKKTDFVAHLGGDKFAIILLNTKNSTTIIDKLIAKINKKLLILCSKITTQKMALSMSIGIACYPESGNDYTTLLQNADIALYKAKEEGRNTYTYCTKASHDVYLRQLTLANDLHFAIEKKELFLEYQPQVEAASQKLIGMETLLRWKHPTLGNIKPHEFIPIAERDSNLKIEIGEWVIRNSCQQYAAWMKNNYKHFTLAINLSALHLESKHFLQRVIPIIEETGMPKENLEFELTESAIMSHSSESIRILQELTTLGIRIAIDDFGTGQSTLERLNVLPINALKIDQSFIKKIFQSENSELVKAMIALARNLNINVIAEGVEEQNQLDFLIEHGCHLAQGYLFSKPMPAEKIETWLTSTSPS